MKCLFLMAEQTDRVAWFAQRKDVRERRIRSALCDQVSYVGTI